MTYVIYTTPFRFLHLVNGLRTGTVLVFEYSTDAAPLWQVGTFNEQPALGVVTPYLTGIVELLYNVVWNGFANALLRDEAHKRPYESAFQVVARMGSILFPRIGAHNPTNYLNAVRYGFPQGKHKKKSPTV